MRIALAAALAALLAGCSGHDARPDRPDPPRAHAPRAKKQELPRVRPLRCPVDAPPGCRAATGRIVYIEAVDPDGDGDAHFVLTSAQSITGPGLTVIDVERELRPHPLPRVGDAVAAAGPVYRGSYGQRQIQALDLRVARARRAAP
jgi:hypothetical protein